MRESIDKLKKMYRSQVANEWWQLAAGRPLNVFNGGQRGTYTRPRGKVNRHIRGMPLGMSWQQWVQHHLDTLRWTFGQ